MMRHRRGFSLIEVVVSAALVATTIGGLFAVASVTTRLTVIGQERLIASQLAREGLEIVRQVRDKNFVSDRCTETTCNEWSRGVFTNLNNLPTGLLTAYDTDNGFKLTEKTVPFTCTDYIVRDLITGTFLPVTNAYVAPAAKQQLFCRRIILERVADIPTTQIPGVDVDESVQAVRVRSQVAWTGYGKTDLRTFTSWTNIGCDPNASEWCTEEAALLTNWRPSL